MASQCKKDFCEVKGLRGKGTDKVLGLVMVVVAMAKLLEVKDI